MKMRTATTITITTQTITRERILTTMTQVVAPEVAEVAAALVQRDGAQK
jgi:hypothetical protein